jgi:cytochrome b561
MPAMRAEPAAVWTDAQRRLHWLTVLLVALAFPLGWLMVAVPLRDLLTKFLLYQLHKTLGIIVFAAVIARLVLRATVGRPEWDADLPRWQRRTAAAMHGLLYAMLLVTPLLGYITAATAPSRIPTLFLFVLPIPNLLPANGAQFAVLWEVHRWAAILLVTLACGHAVAAWHNHRRGRASLLRMWRGGTVSHSSKRWL